MRIMRLQITILNISFLFVIALIAFSGCCSGPNVAELFPGWKGSMIQDGKIPGHQAITDDFQSYLRAHNIVIPPGSDCMWYEDGRGQHAIVFEEEVIGASGGPVNKWWVFWYDKSDQRTKLKTYSCSDHGG
jgi:hypothetical protein